ncbi:olfactory receptor 2G3-like [Ursus americanus]|uniref:Olfactory receptor n=1 Tax=Ursus maritimus TaxID=29073 RepID=A0A384DT89_URSMA|nr:olfactory receptor 2G3-like [Ursus maritimus]XP_045659914.1 olfactory receptor 2G3-like [Ursus americanus]
MVIRNASSFGGFFLLGFSEQPLLEMTLFVIIVLFYLLTLLGNMAIIVLAHLDPRLHTPMYFFLIHLSLMDLCYTTSTVPQLLFNLQGPEKTISYGGCVGQLYVSLAMGSTECILLAVMAVDRYVAVCWPLHYTVLMHPRVCRQLAATTWLTGLASSLVQTVLITQVPLCGRNVIDHVFCEVPVLLKLACVDTTFNQMELFLVSALLLLVPLTLILISYSCIAQAVWKMKSHEGRQKALGTCSSHLVVVFLFYGTAMATYLQPTAATFQNREKFMALLYGIVTPTLNPFIYTLRNKDMKGALRKMIGKD